jgi:Uma2 family endonuclease
MARERYPDLPPIPEDYEAPRQVTHEEYLRLSETLPGKYEYHEGLMYPHFYPPGSHWAMAGGTAAHAQLIVSMLTVLRVHLGNRGPCRVYPSDMQITAAGNDYFPDAYVACGETRPSQRRLEDAVLICEVRSQSTAEFDREAKLEAYKRLPSLHEYLILDNRRPQATLFHKDDAGTWTYLVCTGGATVALATIDLVLSVDDLYEGITLDPDPTSGGRKST